MLSPSAAASLPLHFSLSSLKATSFHPGTGDRGLPVPLSPCEGTGGRTGTPRFPLLSPALCFRTDSDSASPPVCAQSRWARAGEAPAGAPRDFGYEERGCLQRVRRGSRLVWRPEQPGASSRSQAGGAEEQHRHRRVGGGGEQGHRPAAGEGGGNGWRTGAEGTPSEL